MTNFFFGKGTSLSRAQGLDSYTIFKIWHIFKQPSEIYCSRPVSLILWLFRHRVDTNLIYVSDGLISPLLTVKGRRLFSQSRYDRLMIDQPVYDKGDLDFEGQIENYWCPTDVDSRAIKDIEDLRVVCVVMPNDTFLGTSIQEFVEVVSDLRDKFRKPIIISCPNLLDRLRLRILLLNRFAAAAGVEVCSKANTLNLEKGSTLYVTGFTSFHLSAHSGKWFCTYYAGEYGEYLKPLNHYNSGLAVDLEQLPKRLREPQPNMYSPPRHRVGIIKPIRPSALQVLNELRLLLMPGR